MVQFLSDVDVVFASYLLVFGAAAAASFVSLTRVSHIEDPDTRRGLQALLLTSGGWATAHVIFLLVPSAPLKHAFYLVGLVVGLSAVGAWLYFCSAYTNRSLHRQAVYRRAAVGVFLAIIAVKLTNPIHGLYFTGELVTTPFTHLAVTHHLAHWIVMGLSYGLSLVGYFMLLEHFTQVSYKTTPLLALVGVTGLPIVFDIVGFATPYLIDITYEPIGVAVFAVGVVFVYFDRFQAIQLATDQDDPVLVISDDDRIRDYNDSARDLFPTLAEQNVIGEPLWSVLPEVTDALGTESAIIEYERDGETRYYRVSETPFAAQKTHLGRLLVFTDITDQEKYRRELTRQNERLERFASTVSHDLRNPLNVAMARVEIANENEDDENLTTAQRALERMEALISDLLAVARQGQPIDETEPVSLSAIANRCWDMVNTPDANLVVDEDLTFRADPTRLQQLLENLFRNAVEHGSTSSDSETRQDAVEHGGEEVTIHVGALTDTAGFYVADDGHGIPDDKRADVFEMGYSTADSGTGFGLTIVREIAEAHDWTVTLTESDTGGVRVEISGVERVETTPSRRL